MKHRIIQLSGLLAIALLVVGAVASRNLYVGTFVGNGAGLTNAAGNVFADSTTVQGSLGYTPLTNSSAAVLRVLGYTPATNTFSGITNATGLFLITNAVVSSVVTNGDGSITVATTNLVYLGLRP